jgi:hypothetical protein
MPVVALGILALVGYFAVKRALDSIINADVEPALDITAIQSAVEKNGIEAITETETLESAIDDDELDSSIDMHHLQSAVEEQLTDVEGDIESILDSDDIDAVTDHELSAITEQEIIEGTIDADEIGVSIDIDELRSVLERGTGTLERTTDAIATKILDADTSGSLLDIGSDEPIEGTRIAVVDEQGSLESLVDETDPDTTVDSRAQPIDIDDGDDLDTVNENGTDEPPQ